MPDLTLEEFRKEISILLKEMDSGKEQPDLANKLKDICDKYKGLDGFEAEFIQNFKIIFSLNQEKKIFKGDLFKEIMKWELVFKDKLLDIINDLEGVPEIDSRELR